MPIRILSAVLASLFALASPAGPGSPGELPLAGTRAPGAEGGAGGPGPSGVIRGRLVDPAGRPAPSTRIELYRNGAPDGPERRARSAAATGRFRFSGLDPLSSYLLVVPGPGCLAGARRELVPGGPFLEASLDPGSPLAVRVLDDATGAPAASAEVLIAPPGFPLDAVPPPAELACLLRRACEAETGLARFEGLGAGRHRVAARGPGIRPRRRPGDGPRRARRAAHPPAFPAKGARSFGSWTRAPASRSREPGSPRARRSSRTPGSARSLPLRGPTPAAARASARRPAGARGSSSTTTCTRPTRSGCPWTRRPASASSASSAGVRSRESSGTSGGIPEAGVPVSAPGKGRRFEDPDRRARPLPAHAVFPRAGSPSPARPPRAEGPARGAPSSRRVSAPSSTSDPREKPRSGSWTAPPPCGAPGPSCAPARATPPRPTRPRMRRRTRKGGCAPRRRPAPSWRWSSRRDGPSCGCPTARDGAAGTEPVLSLPARSFSGRLVDSSRAPIRDAIVVAAASGGELEEPAPGSIGPARLALGATARRPGAVRTAGSGSGSPRASRGFS